jgi:hypothetical protein
MDKRFWFRFSDWLYRVVKLPIFSASMLVFILFMTLVLPNMAGRLTEMTGIGVSPDTSFIYSAADLYAMAEAYGAEGRAYYIYQRFTFDLIWPIVYLLFFAALITFLYRRLPQQNSWRLVNLLPFAAVIFDLLENSSAAYIMSRYPLPTLVIASLTPLFTLLKWIMIILCAVAVIAGLVMMIRNRQ